MVSPVQCFIVTILLHIYLLNCSHSGSETLPSPDKNSAVNHRLHWVLSQLIN